MTRRYARGLSGHRVRSYAPVNYGPNISVLAAMTQDGIKTAMRVEGATSAEVFLAFLKHFLVPKLKQGDIVVMDNLAAHKVHGVQELISSVGARVQYLPPYSPDYNPIELAFSKIKGFLRSKAAWTKESLDQALTQALASVSNKDTTAWVRHCGYAIRNR